MAAVRRLLACSLLLALVGAGAALAGRGDPQERLTPADQARAKAMVLRRSDLGAGFKSSPSTADDSDFYCKAIDESDLTVTGDASSPDFTRQTQSSYTIVGSQAQVYKTLAQSNTSWQRGTSPAGVRCLRDGTVDAARKGGLRFQSFRRIAFPALAQRSVAFRAVALQQGIPVVFDIIAMQHGRAFAGVSFGSLLVPPARAQEVAAARVVASRMAEAMRRS